ncbi:hypothetical protein [Streptomyces sp. CoT10]|uniref:hypothetical protein n=1 Tax=Streptomyces sp. CoT10 TaxID=2875762 RepID=UPI001CD538ED|nr:hypothetical protein [Streptomyces sp. CoT10]
MGSRVPEVIEALVALGEADPELAGVVVADGPQVTDSAALEWLVIGFDGDPSGDFEAAESVGGWTGLGTRRDEEFQITVAAIVNRGDTDIVAARRRAYEIAARVAAWLSARPNLGLLSVEAAIGTTRLVQDQTEQGAHARLLLTVAGHAFT